MRCEVCGSDTRVVDSREVDAVRKFSIPNTIRRRRICLADRSHRFTTMEITTSQARRLKEQTKQLGKVTDGLRQLIGLPEGEEA